MARKPFYVYKDIEYYDNGFGDYYSEETDKFLIWSPYPHLVSTVIHKDGSVTMNKEKFKENSDANKGVYLQGYEINDDGSTYVKEEDVVDKIKEEAKDNRSTSEPVEDTSQMSQQEVDDIAREAMSDEEYKLYQETKPSEEEHFAGEELYSDDPNRFGDKLKNYNEEMNRSDHEYRFDFGFENGASIREDAFEDAKAYLEEEDMAQYLDESLKSKIDSIRYVLDDESSIHVDVKANQELTPEDLKALKSEIEGQNSDGLGEGFEQQDFAEGYYDPETGDGPYTYQEVMDQVTENYDNMEFEDYQDYIDYEDVREGLESYVRDGNYDVSFEDFLIDRHDYEDEGYQSEEDFRAHLENTPEEQLFEEYSEEYDNWLDEEESSFIESGYAEEYIPSTGIDNAKDEVAKNDPRYNENLWDGGMTSLESSIPDAVDITPKSETVIEDINNIPNNLPNKGYSDYNGLMLADQDKYGARNLSPDNEDRIAEEAWQEAANMKADTDDEKIDRALRMAASDKIGYETTLSSIINVARMNYSGDKTDEEIAPIARRIANEYGLHYQDDMEGQVISDRYIDTNESINRAIENNPHGRVIENIRTGERFYELGNGQWRSYNNGYDYYIDDNSANIDNPRYKDVSTGKLLTNDNKPYNERYSKHFTSGNNLSNGVVTDRAGNIIEYNRYDSNIENLSDDYNYEDSTSDHRTGFGITFSKSEDYIKNKPSNQILKSSIFTKRGLLDGDSDTDIVLTDQTNRINNLFQNQISDLPLFVKGRVYSESEVVDMINTGSQLIANKEGNKAGNDFYKKAYEILEKDGYIKGDIISVNSVKNINKLNRR